MSNEKDSSKQVLGEKNVPIEIEPDLGVKEELSSVKSCKSSFLANNCCDLHPSTVLWVGLCGFCLLQAWRSEIN